MYEHVQESTCLQAEEGGGGVGSALASASAIHFSQHLKGKESW
jgi:hypothetical protein